MKLKMYRNMLYTGKKMHKPKMCCLTLLLLRLEEEVGVEVKFRSFTANKMPTTYNVVTGL